MDVQTTTADYTNGDEEDHDDDDNDDGADEPTTTTTAGTLPLSTTTTASVSSPSSPPPASTSGEAVTASEAGGTGDSGGKNKLDNGELPSPDDNNLYEEPKEPEKPRPTAAKRTDLPSSSTSRSGNSDETGDKGEDSEKDNTATEVTMRTETEDDDDSATYSYPPSNRPVTGQLTTPVTKAPPDTMYTVKATHTYAGEDVDELTFDPGEIIFVIPFENPEEQDDGWQMGIKQSDGIKGVFPENFTVRLTSS